MDMHSGGDQKLDWALIFIEAENEGAAAGLFEARFGRNPYHTTCDCCGPDYSISEQPTLEAVSGFDRGCDFDEKLRTWVDEPGHLAYGRAYVPLAEFLAHDLVLVVRAEEKS